jgi:cGMP-dependent protein kinase
LTDLAVIKPLGSGMFGDVLLCVNRRKDTFYALKAVTRRKVDCYRLAESIKNERTILMMIDHIFIMKLVKTFKDENRIYFLTEFINGLDLFDVLRKLGICLEKDA